MHKNNFGIVVDEPREEALIPFELLRVVLVPRCHLLFAPIHVQQ